MAASRHRHRLARFLEEHGVVMDPTPVLELGSKFQLTLQNGQSPRA
jgi:hypothetical protein